MQAIMSAEDAAAALVRKYDLRTAIAYPPQASAYDGTRPVTNSLMANIRVELIKGSGRVSDPDWCMVLVGFGQVYTHVRVGRAHYAAEGLLEAGYTPTLTRPDEWRDRWRLEAHGPMSLSSVPLPLHGEDVIDGVFVRTPDVVHLLLGLHASVASTKVGIGKRLVDNTMVAGW
jgi:hypothetical protein